MNISRINFLGNVKTDPLGNIMEVDYVYQVLGKSKVLTNREEYYHLLGNRLSGDQGIYLGKI